MKQVILLTIVLGLLFVSTAVAQEPGDTLWTRIYGGSNWDYAFSVQQTTDGGYIIVGRTMSFGAGSADVYLLKTDGNGDTLWTQTYGGSNWESGNSVQQTTDGGYILAGYTNSFGAGLVDVYLVKTDANGDTLWTRTYGGEEYDAGYSVQQTTDGGYIIGGETESFGAGDDDLYLVKTDANGDSLWTRAYGGSRYDWAYPVQQTTDGGYIIAGYTESFGAGGDIYLVKTDANGDTTWTRAYGGEEEDEAWSVQQTTDGGYIVVGETESFGAGGNDVYLVKTDSNGDTLWTRTYGGDNQDIGNFVQETDDGGYIVAGATGSFWADMDLFLVKTDANGDTLWTQTYGGSNREEGYSVQQTADGGYIVAGWTDSFGAGLSDAWLLKVAGEVQLPGVSIEMIPDNPPVVVPQGGSFGFMATVTNNTEDPQITDIWVMASGPEKGIYGPFKEFYDIPLAASQSRSRHLNQRVPNLAPLGFYDYIAYCGDYPSTVIDSSFFQIEVVAGISGSGEDLGWLLSGSFDGSDESSGLPSEFALLSNYPNPFNAQTVIEYQLPVTSGVKLEVYNLIGEKVATLLNEAEEAGYKSVTWDASEVSSGVYFYKLTAGDYTEAKRMVLVK